ncbi:MAG: metalloprotease TldD [Gammaproteobacteria bacterium RIFCSPHIGHO2_12_FULL_35_23]|nr:MAG: metalloprotease TldD [Gammaproteobacteria bacterium RIFCSPHIGHO2_12_FULL_35_23]
MITKTSHFETAMNELLLPAELTEQHLSNLLNDILGNKIDYADIYCQSLQLESWGLEDGVVKEGCYNIERGVGVRAINEQKTGFAYSEDIALPALSKAAMAAKSIAKLGNDKRIKISGPINGLNLYHPVNPITGLSAIEKIQILHEVDQLARKEDPRVVHVIANLVGVYELILIMASDGTLAADIRPLIRLNVSVVVETKGRREKGSSGGGGRYGYETFIQTGAAAYHAKEAVRQALLNLEAVPAPAGTMPVVLGPGWPGVLLHEAIGHGLEGDFNRKGSSAFANRLGEKVASSLCTIVDDGTLVNRRGSLNIDDEGTITQCTTLIKDGILVSYMQDKLNAKLMGMKPTGNGRRESYAHQPMPRMTNTYMLAGSHDPDEIISSISKGIYAVNFGGGQVDITSGKFVFSASEAYLIEKGKIGKPIKGATLIGSGPDILTKVSMVGNDLKLDEGVGTCGKDGQSVPVGVGQPTLRIDEMTVGGTE